MQIFMNYWQLSSLRSWLTLNIRNLGIIMILSILCLSQFAHADSKWMMDRDYVKLIQQDTPVPNDHPINITPETIRMALSSVMINHGKEKNKFFSFGGNETIFDATTLDRLDKSIADHLSRARPDQDVVFHITSRRSAMIGSNNLITTARVFFVNGRLNLIFGEIHADLEKKYIRSGGNTRVNQRITELELRDFHLKTGSRNKYNKSINVTVKDNLGDVFKNRTDWATVDIKNLSATPYVIQKDKIELKEKSDSIPQEIVSDKVTIEDRLIHLKELYNKGIITENAYNKKMQDILNEL